MTYRWSIHLLFMLYFIYRTVLPPVITFPKNAYSFDPGSPVTITCLIDSPNSAIEEVWWLKNGALLPTDGRILVNTGPGSRSSDLEISSADVSDEGSYTCSAKNSAGMGSSDTMLTLSNPFGGADVDVFSSISGDRVGKWLIDRCQKVNFWWNFQLLLTCNKAVIQWEINTLT